MTRHKDVPADTVQRIVDDFELRDAFPPAVEAEARALAERPGLDDPELTDLRGLPFVTIDDAGARDLDQALAVERDGDAFVVHYAIADASHFVRPGSALFEEALRRGASFYLPGRTVPMLPRSLSEGIVSLNAGVDRRAVVFEMKVEPDGRSRETRLVRARMRSRGKLTFEQVQAFVDGLSPCPVPGEPAVAASLRAFRDVGRARLEEAAERDVVRYRRNEVEVKLGGKGMRFVVADGLRNDVERWNEQVSVLCNAEGARFLLEGSADEGIVEPIYRVHPPPEEGRVLAFEAQLEALAASHDLPRQRWTWRRGRSLRAFLEALPDDRVGRAVHRQAMLLNGRSTFSDKPAAHFGVGAEPYARFSAPMREIVGVYVHNEATEKLRGDGRRDPELRARVIDSANRAKDLQKRLDDETNRLVIDRLFEKDLGRTPRPLRSGTLMGITPGKLHVTLDQPAIDVKVYMGDLGRALGGARLAVDGAGVELRRADSGQVLFRLGDAVQLVVQGKDRRRDRWVLVLSTT
jgi:ribonuclease R